MYFYHLLLQYIGQPICMQLNLQRKPNILNSFLLVSVSFIIYRWQLVSLAYQNIEMYTHFAHILLTILIEM